MSSSCLVLLLPCFTNDADVLKQKEFTECIIDSHCLFKKIQSTSDVTLTHTDILFDESMKDTLRRHTYIQISKVLVVVQCVPHHKFVRDLKSYNCENKGVSKRVSHISRGKKRRLKCNFLCLFSFFLLCTFNPDNIRPILYVVLSSPI